MVCRTMRVWSIGYKKQCNTENNAGMPTGQCARTMPLFCNKVNFRYMYEANPSGTVRYQINRSLLIAWPTISDEVLHARFDALTQSPLTKGQRKVNPSMQGQPLTRVALSRAALTLTRVADQFGQNIAPVGWFGESPLAYEISVCISVIGTLRKWIL